MGIKINKLNGELISTNGGDGELPANATLQGNTFNGPNQLVKTNTEGLLPNSVISIFGLKDIVSVKAKGAKGDAIILKDAVVTSGSTTITSATANFTSADIGKTIGIPYAGAGTTVGETHVATITAVNSTTSVVISSAPSKTIAGSRTITDAAINKNTTTLNSATANFTIGDIGKRIEIPEAGLLQADSAGSAQPCYIASVISATQVKITRKSLATVSGKTVTIPGATVIYGTNDTAAIQDAFNEGSANKNVVLLDSGKFLTTAELTVSSYLNVVGRGMGYSVILPVGKNMAAIRGETGSPTNPYVDVQFKDFEIDCRGVRVNTYSTGNKGIYITFMLRPRFSNLHIRNSSATGLGCDFLIDYEINGNVIDHCGAQVFEFGSGGGGSGIGIGTGRWPEEPGLISGNSVHDCGKQGIFLESQSSNILSKGAKVIGNDVSWNGNAGIGDRATEGTIISNNTTRYNAGFGIEVGQGFSPGLFSTNGIISDNTLIFDAVDLKYKEGNFKIKDNFISNGSKAIEVTIVSGGSGADLEISGNDIKNSLYESVYIKSGVLRSLRLNNNFIIDSGNNRPAIKSIININRLYLKNNVAYDNSASGKTQTYGFQASAGTIDRFVHGGNDFFGNATGEIDVTGAIITTEVIQ